MGQQATIGTHRTTIRSVLTERYLRVTYHNTDVVEVKNNILILDNGGYYTKTTKVRMNQASNEFGLKYWVFQKNFAWWCDYQGEVYPFENGKCKIELKD